MTTNDNTTTHPEQLAAEVVKRAQELLSKVEAAVTCPRYRDMGRTENATYDAALDAVVQLRAAVEEISTELQACRSDHARRPSVPLSRQFSRL
jgi:hypothetical protein